jgi:hypothetical protein
MSAPQPTFAELLTELARTKGMIKRSGEVHQSQLGDLLGVDQQTVQRWLKEDGKPQEWRWSHLASVLSITKHELELSIKATLGGDLRNLLELSARMEELAATVDRRFAELEDGEARRDAAIAGVVSKLEGLLDQAAAPLLRDKKARS